MSVPGVFFNLVKAKSSFRVYVQDAFEERRTLAGKEVRDFEVAFKNFLV